MFQKKMIRKTAIDKAKKNTVWDSGNNALYSFVEQKRLHKRQDDVIGKIWLIGRAYAAPIERTDYDYADRIYHKAASGLCRSKIDQMIRSLNKVNPESLNDEYIAKICHLHGELVRIFERASGKNNRSLASKYLHFHLPKIFFIYDSYANFTMKAFLEDRRNLPFLKGSDPSYATFYRRCVELQKWIKEEHGEKLDPREIDRLLRPAA